MLLDKTGVVACLLFSSSYSLALPYKILLSDIGFLHLWIISGYHFYKMRNFLKIMGIYNKVIQNLILFLYIFIFANASIPLVRVFLDSLFKKNIKCFYTRFFIIWYILLCLHAYNIFNYSLLWSLWISFVLFFSKSYSEKLFSLHAWFCTILPLYFSRSTIYIWAWCFDIIWTPWVLYIFWPWSAFIWISGYGLDFFAMSIEHYFYLLQVTRSFLPYGYVSDNESVILLFFSIITIFLVKRNIVWFISYCFLFVYQLLVDPDPSFIHIFSVSRGQSILIHDEQYNYLIDTGDRKHYKKIIDFLHQKKILLDGIILTHADNDHSASIDILRSMLKQPDNIWLPYPSKPLFSPAGYAFKFQHCTKGSSWLLQNYSLIAIHPDDYYLNINDNSCVLLLEGKKPWLIPGDISSKIEKKLDLGKINGLILPHHGSLTSSSAAFLKKLDPNYMVISTSLSSWLKKRDILLSRIDKDQDEKIFVTALDGDLHFEL